MEARHDPELRDLLREWQTPALPSSLEERVLGSPRSWWRVLFRGSIRVPVPAAACLAVLIAGAVWRLARPAPTPAPQIVVKTERVEVPVVQDRVVPKIIYKERSAPVGAETQAPEVADGNASPQGPPVPLAIIRVDEATQAQRLISQVQPVYPPLARQASVHGTVVLHAIIDKDGRVSELQVISGHPLLVQSALDAVRQWRYRPTMLNGNPVEVDTTITVRFEMGAENP